jgi:aminomethyltransferase
MVKFAGYEMPLNYPTGIIQEHNHTRQSASLFDVSHMGRILITGKDSTKSIESVSPIDLVGLSPGRQVYSFFTNSAGGIVDDFMAMNIDSTYQLIVNAANTSIDLDLLKTHAQSNCKIALVETHSLIALQGPYASTALSNLSPECSKMSFMDVRTLLLDGTLCTVSRSGYTGEDGFEIAAPSEDIECLTQTLLEIPGIAPAGLGARDTLRLEAGLCLHGKDISPQISPVEANIAWAIPAARRNGGIREGGFPGARPIFSLLEKGSSRFRVGIEPHGRTPLRSLTPLQTRNGRIVGEITSGSFGPSVQKPIAVAYVDISEKEPGTALHAIVRGKRLNATVVTLPFVETRYHQN